MTAYFIASYDLSDPDEYAKYSPGSLDVIMQTITKHGGSVLSVGTESYWLADDKKVVVVLQFPSMDAAKAWESEPDYQAAKAIRHASTSNRFEVIAPAFVPPES